MSVVDDRIVNMEFNNKQFTKGVDQTKRDLTGLDKALASAGKSKGLTTLAADAQNVSSKFSVMQVAGVTAIATIAHKATTMAGNMLKSFTIAPVMDGFREYQTNLESIQTIMSNTGKGVKEVNHYLGELNEFSDQTIYNFSEMARNIGTFTAAGVKLDTATSSIKGIANLAAMSGSTSAQASNAMYQLSQAIAAGRVSLMDWNSVVNAGMGGKQFQSALARTGVAMGVLNEKAVEVGSTVKIAGESFRDSIGGGDTWMNSDILVNTLAMLDGRFSRTALSLEGFTRKKEQDIQIEKARQELAKKGVKLTDAQLKDILKMSDAAFNAATQIKTLPQLMGVIKESIGSTWANAFTIIMGNFNQSKRLWTSVGDYIVGPQGIVSKMSSGFLQMLRDWAAAGGRKDLLAGLAGIFGGLADVITTIGTAFKEVFGGNTAESLVNFTKNFRKFGEAIRPSEDSLESIKSIFKGLFSILHIGQTAFSAITGAIFNFIGALFSSSESSRGGILSILGSIGEVIVSLDEWLTKGGQVQDFMSKFGSAAGATISPLIGAFGLLIKAVAALASGQGLSAVNDILLDAKGKFLDFISGVLDGAARITAPFEKISEFFSKLRDKVDDLRDSFKGVTSPLDNIDLPVSLDGFNNVKDDFGAKISSGFGKIGSSAEGAKDKASQLIGTLSDSKAKSAEASTLAIASASESSGSALQSLGDIGSRILPMITGAFGKIGDFFGWIGGQFKDLFGSYDAIEWASVINAVLTGAMLLSIKKFFDGLADSLSRFGTSVTDAIDSFTGSMDTMQNTLKAKMLQSIAYAVVALAAGLLVLSLIPADKLKTGLAGMTAALAVLTGTLFAMSKIDGDFDTAKLAASLVLIAGALLILAAAIAIFSNIPREELIQGLTAFTFVMAILIASIKAFASMEGEVKGFAGSILLISIAMNLLAAAVFAFGMMPLDVLAQGMAAFAVALGLLTVSLMLLSKNTKGIAGAGAAMLMMAIAMDIVIAAIITLGLLPWDVVEQGLKGLALGLLAMTLPLMLLAGGSQKVIFAATAMLIMAAAMNVMMSVIIGLGVLPWKVVEQGLMALAMGLVVVLAAAAIAMSVIPGLQALGTTIALLGLALMAAGAGVALFAAGFALLVASGVAGVAILVVAFHAFMALLPTLAVQLAAAFTAFLKTIAAASPKIRKAMGQIIENLLGIVTDAIPEIGKVFQALLDEAIKIIRNTVPDLIDAGIHIIAEFLASVERELPGIIDSAFKIVELFIEAIGQRIPQLANAGAQMIIDVLNGLSDAIDKRGDEIRAAARRLATTFVDELKETLSSMIKNISLPSIPMPKLPGKLGEWAKGNFFGADTSSGGRGGIGIDAMMRKTVTAAQAIAKATEVVAAALAGANALLTEADKSGTASAYQAEAQKAQGQAYYYSEQAALRDETATKAEKAADKAMNKAEKIKDKEARKKAMKRARRQAKRAENLRKQADGAATAAEKKQAEADAKAQLAQEELRFATSDSRGKGDVRSEQGQALAEQAQALLEKANAEAAEARKLAKGTKAERARAKRLREQARKDAEEAQRLADEANKKQAEAVQWYNQARAEAAQQVRERLTGIRDSLADEEKARADAKEYEEADTARKIEIMEERAKANDAKREAALKAYEAAMSAAEANADTDAEAAMGFLDEAEKQARIASDAAAKAEEERREAENLRNGGPGGSNSGGSNLSITPSRTALEDAAKVLDRYTQSLVQAEEMAAAGGKTVQYVQHVYSPKALSTAEIYRQGKNLVSSHLE